MADHGLTGTHHIDGSQCFGQEDGNGNVLVDCTWSANAYMAQSGGFRGLVKQASLHVASQGHAYMSPGKNSPHTGCIDYIRDMNGRQVVCHQSEIAPVHSVHARVAASNPHENKPGRANEHKCRHPYCKDTNWGGHDRIHTKGEECPDVMSCNNPDCLDVHRTDEESTECYKRWIEVTRRPKGTTILSCGCGIPWVPEHGRSVQVMGKEVLVCNAHGVVAIDDYR